MTERSDLFQFYHYCIISTLHIKTALVLLGCLNITVDCTSFVSAHCAGNSYISFTMGCV